MREGDGFCRVFLGYTQEELDYIHEGADRLRAIIGSPKPWYPYETDLDSSDGEDAPMSPPQSPRDEDVLDISYKGWDRQKWYDRSMGLDPKDTGNDKFETWRARAISEHAKRHSPNATSWKITNQIQTPSSTTSLKSTNEMENLSSAASLKIRDVIKKSKKSSTRPVPVVSDRLVFHILQPCSFRWRKALDWLDLRPRRHLGFTSSVMMARPASLYLPSRQQDLWNRFLHLRQQDLFGSVHVGILMGSRRNDLPMRFVFRNVGLKDTPYFA